MESSIKFVSKCCVVTWRATLLVKPLKRMDPYKHMEAHGDMECDRHRQGQNFLPVADRFQATIPQEDIRGGSCSAPLT